VLAVHRLEHFLKRLVIDQSLAVELFDFFEGDGGFVEIGGSGSELAGGAAEEANDCGGADPDEMADQGDDGGRHQDYAEDGAAITHDCCPAELR
jgi:hypothetical protein